MYRWFNLCIIVDCKSQYIAYFVNYKSQNITYFVDCKSQIRCKGTTFFAIMQIKSEKTPKFERFFFTGIQNLLFGLALRMRSIVGCQFVLSYLN